MSENVNGEKCATAYDPKGKEKKIIVLIVSNYLI